MADDNLKQTLARAERLLQNGAPPEQVNAAVMQATGFATVEELRQAVASTDVNLRNMLRSAAQGATFGFGDELYGLGAAALGGDYQAARDEVRQNQRAFAEAHPWFDFAAQMAGGMILPGLGAERALGKGAATVGQAAMRGAKLGAAGGALAGVGAAEGDVGRQVQSGIFGGLAGGALGGALSGGIAALSGAGRLAPEAAARARLAGAIERGGGEEAAIASAEGFRRAGRGAEVTLADLSDPLRSQADWAANASDDVLERMGALTGRRQVRSPVNVLSDVREELGNPIMKEKLDELVAERVEWANKHYSRLRAENPHVANADEVMELLNSPTAQQLWGDAQRAGFQGPQPPAGPLSFETLFRTYQDLQVLAEKAGQNRHVPLMQRFSALAKSLGDLIEEGVPEFRAVQTGYRLRKRAEEALLEGVEAWRENDSRMLQQMLDRLPTDRHRDLFRFGMASELLTNLRSGVGQRQAAGRLVAAQAADDVALNDKLKVVFGTEERFRRVMDKAKHEFELLRLSKATQNSATARRLMAQGQDVVQELVNPVSEGVEFGPIAAAAGVARRAGRAAGKKLERAQAEATGNLLMTRGVDDVIALIRQLQAKQRLTYPFSPAVQLPLSAYTGGRIGGP